MDKQYRVLINLMIILLIILAVVNSQKNTRIKEELEILEVLIEKLERNQK